jgi:hypothetical protein
MQAKTSVSDYRESGKLPWATRQAVPPGSKKPELVILSPESLQVNLKPGLY